MVKLEEHINKMEEIKKQAENSKGRQRLQLMKCYHRLNKQLVEAYANIKAEDNIEYIKIMR